MGANIEWAEFGNMADIAIYGWWEDFYAPMELTKRGIEGTLKGVEESSEGDNMNKKRRRQAGAELSQAQDS